MSVFNYEVSLSPSEPSIQISVNQISATEITVQLDSVGDFKMTLKPSGNITQEALSAIVWPVAQLIALAIPGKVRDGLEGQTFSQSFANPLGYQFLVNGVEIQVQPQTLTFSNYNGMLMATGSVTVS